MKKSIKNLSIILIISNLLVFLCILLKYFNTITIPTGIFGSEYFFSKMNRGIDYLNSIKPNNSPGTWYIFYLYIFYIGYILKYIINNKSRMTVGQKQVANAVEAWLRRKLNNPGEYGNFSCVW